MNKMIKFSFKKCPYHGTNEMFKELSMLKIKGIYEADILKFVYKCINEPSTPILRTFFQKRKEFHDRDWGIRTDCIYLLLPQLLLRVELGILGFLSGTSCLKK